MKVIHTKGYNKKIVSWKDALDNFNWSLNNNDDIKHNDFGFFVSHRADQIKRVKPVLEDLKCNSAHLYFNIITKAKTFGNHKDTMDVWFWQCQGKTKWIIEDKTVYNLNSGDLIYVPKGIKHEVIPLTPRVGISMAKE